LLNSQYIKKIELEELIQRVRPFMEAKDIPTGSRSFEKSYLFFQGEVKTLVEMADHSEFYFSDEIFMMRKLPGSF